MGLDVDCSPAYQLTPDEQARAQAWIAEHWDTVYHRPTLGLFTCEQARRLRFMQWLYQRGLLHEYAALSWQQHVDGEMLMACLRAWANVRKTLASQNWPSRIAAYRGIDPSLGPPYLL